MPSSVRRCQVVSVMSSPMPAGSPSVSASGRGIGLFVLDIGLVTQFLEKLLGIDLELLGYMFVANLAPGRCVVGIRFFLRAQRVELDCLHGAFGRGQLANFRFLQNLAQLRRKVG